MINSGVPTILHQFYNQNKYPILISYISVKVIIFPKFTFYLMNNNHFKYFIIQIIHIFIFTIF